MTKEDFSLDHNNQILTIYKMNLSQQTRKLYQPPPPEDDTKNYYRLTVVILISFVFITAELFGGYLSGSIAIISDAFHLVSDLVGFILSFTFIKLSRRAATNTMTFGFHRMELLGGLSNLFIIWIIAVFFVYEAITRIVNHQFVAQPRIMLIVAAGGLGVNILMYFVLHHEEEHSHGLLADPCSHDEDDHQGHQHAGEYQIQFDEDQADHHGHNHGIHNHQSHEGHNHQSHEGHNHQSHEGHNHQSHEGQSHAHHQDEKPNFSHESLGMQAAILHALSDIIQSVGVLISAIFIFFFGSDNGADVTEWNNWHLFDPISTFLFSLIAVGATFPIVKNCYLLIMESVPSRFDISGVKTDCQSINGIVDVHDIHIWDLRAGKTILIGHVLAQKGKQRSVLASLTEYARRKKIYHTTFQVEEQDEKEMKANEYIACHHDIH